MPPPYFPLRWESTGQQWWYATPIDCAAANGHYDLVRELLHLDPNLLIKLTSLRRIRRLETVWDDEAQFNDVAKCRSHVAQKLLIECEKSRGHNSLIRAGYGGWLLYTAASAGDVGFAKELLDRDPLLAFGEGEYGVSDILYAAARSKNCELFRLLLDFTVSQRCFHGGGGGGGGGLGEKGEEISSVFKWEMMNRAVHAAARGGIVEILREIIGESSDVLAYRDDQGSTVLHAASGRGQVEVVKHLLASFDIITSTDNQGNTALNVAAYRGYLAVVEVLISASPSVTAVTNNDGDTFLHMAVAGFRSPGFRRLDRQIELMKQLVSGKLVNTQDIINVRNNCGRTALHTAAVMENIQPDLVELLMNVPSINLNLRDDDGMTPLDLLKQKPPSASSEIFIKQLISAGGISNCQDYTRRSALASHLIKMEGIGGSRSPGTSFRIPDAEIFLYTPSSTEPCNFNSPTEPNSSNSRKSRSVNYSARRLKFLLRWTRKDRKAELDEDSSSSELHKICGSLEDSTPTPLRQRFSKHSSLPNNKRIVSIGNSLPSPSTKKKFATRLTHGVIQAAPQLAVRSPSSRFSSESSGSSTVTTDDKHKGVEVGNEIEESFGSNRSFNVEKLGMKHERTSFNSRRSMNQYFCFGAQGIVVEDSISCTRPPHGYKRSTSLVA